MLASLDQVVKLPWLDKRLRGLVVLFDTEYRFAKMESGDSVEFTHAESLILQFLSRRPQKVLSRQQIQEGVFGNTNSASDRNVDHLINRIRKKLGDDPKNPRFIGTRYGGGYFWVAAASKPSTVTASASVKVIIGPVHGIGFLGEKSDIANAFLRALANSVRRIDHLSNSQVAIIQNFDPTNDGALLAPERMLEVTFFETRSKPEAIVSCRTPAMSSIPSVKRINLSKANPSSRAFAGDCDENVKELFADRWRLDVSHHLQNAPLALAMFEATLDSKDSRTAWRKHAPLIERLKAESPQDPIVGLMEACHIYLRHVSFGWEMSKHADMDPAEDLKRIEHLVAEHLGELAAAPELQLMAAKLLHYSNPAYLHTALELARDAQRSATPVATSMAILGQLEAFAGQTDSALEHLKQAEVLCKKGTRLHLFILTLCCQALIASGRREDLIPFKAALIKNSPASRFIFEPILTDPQKPSVFAKGVMLAMKKQAAADLLSFFDLVFARLCEDPRHGANAIRAPHALFVRRFGAQNVPEAIKQAYGDYL